MNSVEKKIIESALKLFKQYGYKKVTIDEISKLANVSRMTFYNYFKNKKEAAIRVIDYVIDNYTGEFQRIINSKQNFSKIITDIILKKIQVADEFGEIFIKDILEREPELKKHIYAMQETSYRLSLEMYEKGLDAGFIRKNISPEYFLVLLEELSSFADKESFKKMFPDINQRINEAVSLLFYGIYDYKQGDLK